MKSVCVIGAGPSGLTTAKWFRDEGFKVTVMEEDDAVGGMWLYQKQRVYDSLSTNSSKEMMEFSDFPFPPDIHAEEYPHANKIVAYYQAYAKQFGLSSLVEFNTRVISVVPRSDSRMPQWEVTVEQNSRGVKNKVKRIFDAVIVCCGLYRTPKMVEYPGQHTYTGRLEHAQVYRKPDEYKGKTVLVIGAGNSSMDIAVELAGVAKKVIVSTRSGVFLVPVFDPASKRPADASQLTRYNFYECPPSTFFKTMYESSKKWQDKFHQYGMPPIPKARSDLRFAVIKRPDDWVKELEKKNIVFGTVKQFEGGRKITFENGASEDVNDVILCTGYQNLDFPFFQKLPGLPPHHQLPPSLDGEYLSLYRHVVHPRFNTLGFMGFVDSPGNLAVVSEVQARWMINVLQGKVTLPSEDIMLSACKKEIDERPSPKRGYWIVYVKYMDQLARDIGVFPTQYNSQEALMKLNPKLYRALREGGLRGSHFRLQGPHALSDAEAGVVNDSCLLYPPLPPTKSKL